MGLDLIDQRLRFVFQFAGQGLDIIASAQGIGDRGHTAFFGQDELGVAGDSGREIGRQSDRFVEAVGVERLGSAEHRGKRLDRGPDDIVIRVLFGQRHAAGLAMRAQQLRLFRCRAEPGHDPRPQGPRRAQFGDLHEQVHADAEEEAQPRREGIDVEARRGRRADIGHAVGEGVSEFLDRGRAGFVHVITGDRNAVELGHFAAGESDDVADDLHRGFGRVDVGVADREFFQNVVLDRARQSGALHPLLLPSDDVEGHDRKHRAVHRHADRHFIERDSVEQQFHVLDAVDRDPGLADVAGDSRMVRIVAAVGGEIEGDRQALLPGGEVAAVKGVGFLGGREAGILADGPRPPGEHRRIRPAGVGRDAGVAGIDPGDIGGAVYRLQRDSLGRVTGEVAALRLLGGERFPLGEIVGHATALANPLPLRERDTQPWRETSLGEVG